MLSNCIYMVSSRFIYFQFATPVQAVQKATGGAIISVLSAKNMPIQLTLELARLVEEEQAAVHSSCAIAAPAN